MEIIRLHDNDDPKIQVLDLNLTFVGPVNMNTQICEYDDIKNHICHLKSWFCKTTSPTGIVAFVSPKLSFGFPSRCAASAVRLWSSTALPGYRRVIKMPRK